MIPSYPSIYALGHKFLGELFSGPVIIEEKIDGSQFSFGLYDSGLVFRPKGQQIHPGGPEKMFNNAVTAVQNMHQLYGLVPGWTYRAEYLSKCKHNCLTYGRVPQNFLVLFDVMTHEGEHYLDPATKQTEAIRLGIDCTPCFYAGAGESVGTLRFDDDRTEIHCSGSCTISNTDLSSVLTPLFERESFLGGCRIEGVVVKNYNRFGPDKHILVGKFVSPLFKEKHVGEWKKANPTKADIEERLIAEMTSEARWRKAIQHLSERALINGTPQDIGPIMKEAAADILKEEEDYIKDTLFKHFAPKIVRGATAGIPAFYKKEIGLLQ